MAVDFPFDSFFDSFGMEAFYIKSENINSYQQNNSEAISVEIIFHGRSEEAVNFVGAQLIPKDAKIIDCQIVASIGDYFLVESVLYRIVFIDSQSPINQEIANMFSYFVTEYSREDQSPLKKYDML